MSKPATVYQLVASGPLACFAARGEIRSPAAFATEEAARRRLDRFLRDATDPSRLDALDASLARVRVEPLEVVTE